MERIIDMSLSGCNCGVAITGSFCTFDKVKIEIEEMTCDLKKQIPQNRLSKDLARSLR